MRPLKRGQMWTVPTVGRDRTVVVVQSDHLPESHAEAVLCALVDTSGERRGSLVTVTITEPLPGLVLTPDLDSFRKVRFEQGTFLGDVPLVEMEHVDMALRAVLAL